MKHLTRKFFFRSKLEMLFLAACIGICNSAGAAATEPRGLDAITQFDRLPYLKPDTMEEGQSSFDRSGGNSDFGNFLYRDPDGTNKVLLDVAGPGTVYRIWFTGFNQATDYIKVYFDGETTPRIDMLLNDLYAGTNAPFLSPLVANNLVSSGGFYCYLPLPFNRSIKIVSNATAGSFYYNIGYHVYSQDTTVTTWTGLEDSTAARNLWKNVGSDPKSDSGNVVVSNAFNLAPSGSQTLLDISGPYSISSIKLNFPGINFAAPLTITDDGRADKGYSQFQMAINPTNTGVELVRRLDYGIGNQKANVYVDGTLIGQWFDAGSDQTYHWRDSGFNIPSTYTTGKSAITVKVSYVSSDVDWNEFYYWAYSLSAASSNLTDSLDVGNSSSETNHAYVINTQTWSGVRTFQYPPGEDPNTIELLTNTWLSISFDNETNPSVYAPVSSFFAMGQFAPYPVRALPVGVDANSNLYCYFPMPFGSHATVQLVSFRAVTTSNITCELRYKPFTDSLARVGYFKTQYNSELPTTNGADIVMLDAEGTGHFVGVVESMMGVVSRYYLEGDERIYVDNSASPAIYGTGTEDFYDAGWYFQNGLFSLPINGNPAHVADANYDRTTAYRFFLSDAIPFRKHITVGIQHGGVDDSSENVWTLAYYYCQPTNHAILTDQLLVGNTPSEAAHSYSINTQTWTGTRSYTFDGNFDTVIVTNTGRAHKGYSQFTMALSPTNAGAILRRQFDQGVANQKANVYVDGVLAGVWYRAGSNTIHNWRDDDFMVPSAFTSGKNAIQVQVQFLSSSNDWNEFVYSIYSLPIITNATPPRLIGGTWRGNAFAISLSGDPHTGYGVWASTNLANWGWLGTASETSPGIYGFTDTTANGIPQRFYRGKSP
ncbi:MAG TPA: DUF2961 domain-containing protein [Verrucomicrobiae bacterium]|nr:DUF2961 domain-containing protein [Verrucomicrobiae bacterium]